MRKLVRTENGFSLIELMVVVGIIGILAAIAVPQFSKFQAKARQTEAKTNLAALYTSEKGFYTEYTWYTLDLKNAGFGVEGTRLRYDIGFPMAAVNAAYPGAGGGMPVETLANSLASGVSSVNFIVGTPTIGAVANNAAYSATAFTAMAYGDPNNGPVVAAKDGWQINEAKALVNSTPGIQ